VGNISIEEYPEFSDKCIYCFSCVRSCPEGAIKARLKPLEPVVRGFAKFFGKYEELVTEIIKKT
jgi:ferredoxin